jgi:hypothetical protein
MDLVIAQFIQPCLDYRKNFRQTPTVCQVVIKGLSEDVSSELFSEENHYR